MLGDLPLNAPPGWLNVMTGVKGLRNALAGGGLVLGRGPSSSIPETLIEALEATAARLRPALSAIRASLRANAERLERQAADYLGRRTVASSPRARRGGRRDRPRGCFREGRHGGAEEAGARCRVRLADELDGRADPEARRRTRRSGSGRSLLLTLRFDEPSITDWSGWDAWLARAAEQDEVALNAYRTLAAESPAGFLLLWARCRADCPAEAREALELHCRGT